MSKKKVAETESTEPIEVSDAELLGVLAGEHKIGSVARGQGSTSAGAGLPNIPWSMLVDLLLKLGLPLAKRGLIALRADIAGRAWPAFVKDPLLKVIDKLLADDNQVTVMSNTMKARYDAAS